MQMVRILTPTRRFELARFATVSEAAAWRWHRDLDASHPILDGRDPDDPGRAAELPVIAGLVLRDRLEPLWRNCQYDRLVARAIRRLPEVLAEGLEAGSNLLAARCLAQSDVTGWDAVSGRIRTARRGPIRLSTDIREPHTHSWCAGPQGILDITATIYRRAPVTFLPCEDIAVDDFLPESPILDGAAEDLADLWMSRIGTDVVGALRDAGVALMNPEPEGPDRTGGSDTKVDAGLDDVEEWPIPEA